MKSRSDLLGLVLLAVSVSIAATAFIQTAKSMRSAQSALYVALISNRAPASIAGGGK